MADEAIDLKAIAAVAAAMKAEGQGIPVEVMSEPSKTADLERQLGLTARYGAQGLAGVAGLAYDPIAAVQNYLFGTETQPLREQVKRALTDLGVPEPETATERVIGAISEGAVGAGGQAAIARGAERVLTTGAQRVAGQLAAQPGAQAAAGGTGGGAAQAVAEAGGGPGAQLAAGLVGGIAGGRAAGVRMEAPSAALPAAVREAEDAGVRVMTTDVVKPTTFAGKWLQRSGEMIPYAGTGGVRAAQQEARTDAAVDLLRNYGVTETLAADNTAISKVTKDLLGRRGDNLTKYTGMKTEVIERLAQPNVTVPVTKTVAKIDEEIARLNKISPTQFKPVIDRLMTWRDDLTGTREVTLPNGQKQVVQQGQPLDVVEELRKQIGEAFKDQSLASVRSQGEKVLSSIYAPLREEMGDYIKANGQRRDFDKWNIANKQLSSMADDLELGVLKNTLAKGDVTPETVRSMLFSVNPSDAKALYRGLSSEGKSNARTAVLQEAFNRVGGKFDELSPDQFKRTLIRLGTPIGVFFSGQDLKAVEGLIRTLKMTERAGRAGVLPESGLQNQPIIGGSVAVDVLGGAGAATTSILTIGGIARLYESAPVRNILLKLPQTTKGSPQEQELIKQLTVALRAEKAAEEQPQTAPQ